MSTKKIQCRYFLYGYCNLGSQCTFSHDKSCEPTQVCRYYLNGKCPFEKRCRYDHVKPQSQTKQSCTQALTNEATSNNDDLQSVDVESILESSIFIDSDKPNNIVTISSALTSIIPQSPSKLTPSPTNNDNLITNIDNALSISPSPSYYVLNDTVYYNNGTNKSITKLPNQIDPGHYINEIENAYREEAFDRKDLTSITKITIIEEGTEESDEVKKAIKQKILNVNAKEFYPAYNTLMSYSEAVRTNLENTTPSLDTRPLCPYSLEGECMFGKDRCVYLHGLLCDVCQKNVLHPYDEEQSKSHQEACLKEMQLEMEFSFAVQRSEEKTCGICYEKVLESTSDYDNNPDKRFGILPNCQHCYCLPCIMNWRKTKNQTIDHSTIRSCPECRIQSYFIMPSRIWVEEKLEKERMIEEYKKTLGDKHCKYFLKGSGKCPLNSICFYKHAYPDGTLASRAPSSNYHRSSNRSGRSSMAAELLLWDFFAARFDSLELLGQNFVDLVMEDNLDDFTSESEEDDIDFYPAFNNFNRHFGYNNSNDNLSDSSEAMVLINTSNNRNNQGNIRRNNNDDRENNGQSLNNERRNSLINSNNRNANISNDAPRNNLTRTSGNNNTSNSRRNNNVNNYQGNGGGSNRRNRNNNRNNNNGNNPTNVNDRNSNSTLTRSGVNNESRKRR
ncbi:E3 ubiquitin-protein ligase makorin-1-like isoform X2 [Gordionus sp. m RMFG-2023]|uniref:E3 ubiquitin-protein ligase makorin-1-like isoform X2 n=1 Tax=Gordionus sp. m RMFG-2023 TaxID=3053472 RepID=UPI0031FE2899